MVGDITYIPTWEGWEYLVRVIDCATRKVTGGAMGENYKTPLITAAIEMAARNIDLPAGAGFHSDRGDHHISPEFAWVLARLGICESVGRTGICFEMRWRNRLTRRWRSSGCTGPRTRRERKHGRTLPGTSRSVIIASVSLGTRLTGLRNKPRTTT